MRTADFDQIVEQAFRRIPARFRSRMQNVAVLVEDEPPTQRGRIPNASTLLGLYEGRPLAYRGVSEGKAFGPSASFQRTPIQLALKNDNLHRLEAHGRFSSM
jgi:predicted Zn-dependent protease with MMP-like domain